MSETVEERRRRQERYRRASELWKMSTDVTVIPLSDDGGTTINYGNTTINFPNSEDR